MNKYAATRERLCIHGVPGTENSWEITRIKLSTFISDLSEQKLKSDDIYNTIVRSHRGGLGFSTHCYPLWYVSSHSCT